MGFDRTHLPETVSFFEGEGLPLTGRGKWRSTQCRFHGGSDSLRINTESGGWCCMACGAHGGDVLAYRIAVTGEDFITAAKALGAWVEDGRPAPRNPAPLSPRDALTLLASEANLAAVAAANVGRGVALNAADCERLLVAVGRINLVREWYQP
ncbi:hypothetical protein [Ottowia sp.]|nr:hypothetical protein [Ottowia sp.]HOB65819.1 hypothetical protein [Ottowia sp.]HPZ57128.1 hypothetical protein [Ottowia sp.]HQD46817.1 hypothetical protein [Ottowia sp.]